MHTKILQFFVNFFLIGTIFVSQQQEAQSTSQRFDGMLTRRAVREQASCQSPLPPLPRTLALEVFARVPVDQRLLLAFVSRAWRAAASEPALFRCVDLSTGSGVEHVNDSLLLAISAKARGLLRSLDVAGRVGPAYPILRERISVDALVRVVGDNAGSLQHLRALCTLDEQGEVQHVLKHEEVCRLQQATAGTTRLDVDLQCRTLTQLRALLRTGATASLFVRRLILPVSQRLGGRCRCTGFSRFTSIFSPSFYCGTLLWEPQVKWKILWAGPLRAA